MGWRLPLLCLLAVHVLLVSPAAAGRSLLHDAQPPASTSSGAQARVPPGFEQPSPSPRAAGISQRIPTRTGHLQQGEESKTGAQEMPPPPEKEGIYEGECIFTGAIVLGGIMMFAFAAVFCYIRVTKSGSQDDGNKKWFV